MLFKIRQANTCASTSTDSEFDKLVKASLVLSRRLGPSVMSMKGIYCMVVKEAAKQSLQNCRSTLMTNCSFSLLQDSPVCRCFVRQIQVCSKYCRTMMMMELFRI